MQVLGKTISYDFFDDSEINSDKQESFQLYCARQMQIGTADRILFFRTFPAQHWFEDMRNDTFEWPYFILTESGLFCSTNQFLHFAVTAIVYVIRPLQLHKKFRK